MSRNGLYNHMLRSFELTNALADLMDMMNKVFMEYRDKIVIVFIDDILVCSEKEEEHKEYPCLVL
jgi:hypothetical protein